jgi:hypothetical protein
MRYITVDVLDPDGDTLHASIPAGDMQYGEETSDAAACRIKVPADHASVPDLVPGNLLWFRAIGTPDAVFVIVNVREGLLRPRGKERAVEVQGLDWVCLLGDAPVTPTFGIESKPYATEVRFDWTHPALNRTGWVAPTAIGAVWGATIDWLDNPAAAAAPGQWNAPTSHTDPAAQWIWGQAVDGSYSHPPGVCYFHRDMTVTGASKIVAFVWTADDRGALAVDGVVIDPGVDAPSAQYTQARIAAVELTPGTHTLDVRATNDLWLGASGSYSQGRVTVTAYDLPTAAARMKADTVWFRTSTSNPGWSTLAYPGYEPGFTVTHATRLLVQRAQADGHLPGVTLGFTDSAFSGGAPAPVTSELVARTQDSVLDTLRAWSSLGHCDFAFDVTSRTLLMWPFQGRPGSTITLTEDDLAAVVRERRR